MQTFDFTTCQAHDYALIQAKRDAHTHDQSKFFKHISTLYKVWAMSGQAPVEVERRSSTNPNVPNVGSTVEVCVRRLMGKHITTKASGKGFDCYYDGHKYEIKYTTSKEFRSTGITASEWKTAYGVIVCTEAGVYILTKQQLLDLDLMRKVDFTQSDKNYNIVAYNNSDYIKAGLTPIPYEAL